MRGFHNRLALIAAMSLVATSAAYGGQELSSARPQDPPKPKPKAPREPVTVSPADPAERFVPLERRNFSRKKRKHLRAKGLL